MNCFFQLSEVQSAETPIEARDLPLCDSMVLEDVQELDDGDMLHAINIINDTFPGTGELQATTLGAFCRNKTMPLFKPVSGKFVQIFHLPNHWAVGTNMLSSSSHDIYWFDSKPKYFITSEAIVQLSSLLRSDTEEQLITLRLRNNDC